MKVTPGTVILVKFPFTSLEAEKKRPALVMSSVKLSSSITLVTIAMITSQIEKLKLNGDCLLKEWREANLLHPSLLRLSKLATIESLIVDRELGVLSPEDRRAIRTAFSKLYSAWI